MLEGFIESNAGTTLGGTLHKLGTTDADDKGSHEVPE
jgi:hypothetical protein